MRQLCSTHSIRFPPRIAAARAASGASAKRSAAAVLALILAIVAPFWMVNFVTNGYGADMPQMILFVASTWPALLSALVAPLAMYRIRSSAGKLRGVGIAAVGLVLASVVLVGSSDFVLN